MKKAVCRESELNHLFTCFIPFIFLCCSLSGCSSLSALTAPKSFTDGTALYQSGNYDEASRLFEETVRANPNDESFVLALAEAHYKAAEADFRRAENAGAQDLRSIIEHCRNAAARAEKSIAALSVSLSKPDMGPSLMDKMKKIKDEKHKPLREQQEAVSRDATDLKKLSSEKLQAAQADLDKVLRETARILSLNRASPASAYDEYVPFFIYAKYLQEVRDAKLEIEQITIRQLELNGLAQINALKYTEAEKAFTRAGAIEGGSDIAKAGLLAVAAQKALAGKNYAVAFEKLLEIRSIHPASAFLKAHYEKTQLLLLKIKLAEVDALIAKGALPGFIAALEKLAEFSDATKGVAQGNAEFLATIEKRTKLLRSMVATDLIRRAAQLKKEGATLYSSLILRSLQLARQFDPEQVNKLEEDAVNALDITSRKSEMKVYVAYEGAGGLALEWAKRLESDLLSNLEKSGIPGVSILDQNSLKGAETGNLNVVDMAIKGSMDAVEFTENGRDTPSRRSSRYVSGTRQVHNPEYPRAEQACRQAEANYNRLSALREKAQRECNNIGDAILRMVCDAGVSYVSENDKNTTCAKWQATPMTRDENVVSSYQYDQYAVKLNGLVRSKCAMVDNLNRSAEQCTAINEKIKREGTIIANTQSTDTQGVRDAEVDVPDLLKEQETAYKQVFETVSAELLKNVAAVRAGRYCKQAKSQNNNLKAMEAYSMCAFVLDQDRAERGAELNDKLNKFFVISPAQAQTLGVQGKGENMAWPSSHAEVEDKGMNVGMLKQRK